jgi:hypothetical protein
VALGGLRYFTQEEAQAKLGQIVWTRVAGRRIPQGTQGRVLYARWQGQGLGFNGP